MSAQPSPLPTAKVTSAGLSGALAVILLWAAETAGVVMPAEVAGAIVLVTMTLLAYVTEDN